MANIKSQQKRNRTNELARLRNKSVKSSLRTAVRAFRDAAEAGDKDKAAELLAVDQPQIGQGGQQGRHPQEPGRQQEVGAGEDPQQDLSPAFGLRLTGPGRTPTRQPS